jgi:DNA-binding transcriptional ArsR family regulator
MSRERALKLESELRGRTLRVYFELLSMRGPVGPRELQRALKLSSPSLAAYHLDKLVELGLVKCDRGEYILEEAVHVGVLKQFIFFGRLAIPRHLLYATFFTAALVTYLVLYPQPLVFANVAAWLFGSVAAGVNWYETWRALHMRP